MNTKLKNWAEEVVLKCNPIAKENNLEYYPFQSPINENKTDILIVGVNPRSNGNHKSQSENPKWEFENGKMQLNRLLKGNPYFRNDTSWRFFYNLRQIGFLKEVIEQGNYTYMNYFYFSTKDADEMKKIKAFNEIVNFSVEKLNELIEILKPKVVIVLGVADGLDIITKNETIISKGSKRILTKGILNGNTIYGIPHSSRNYAYDVREILSINLLNLFDNKEITKFSIPDNSGNKSVKRNVDVNKINNNLERFGFVFKEFNGKKGLYQAIVKGLNNDILDFRLDVAKSYLSFRSNEKVNNSFYELEGKDIYVNFFDKTSEIQKNNWLVYKDLKNYKADQSIEEQIVNDLKNFFQTLK